MQVYAPTTDAKKVEVDCFYGDLQHLLELIQKQNKTKHVLFFIGDWNAKVRSQYILRKKISLAL